MRDSGSDAFTLSGVVLSAPSKGRKNPPPYACRPRGDAVLEKSTDAERYTFLFFFF